MKSIKRGREKKIADATSSWPVVFKSVNNIPQPMNVSVDIKSGTKHLKLERADLFKFLMDIFASFVVNFKILCSRSFNEFTEQLGFIFYQGCTYIPPIDRGTVGGGAKFINLSARMD